MRKLLEDVHTFQVAQPSPLPSWLRRERKVAMRYWDNGDGTFTVMAWEVTYDRSYSADFENHSSILVYTQEIALEKFSHPAAQEMNLRLLVRDHRPAVGTEVGPL